MFRGVWIAIALGGCGRGGFDILIDAPDAPDAPGTTVDTASPFCPQVPELVACFDFENGAIDASMYGNTPSGSTSFGAGHTGMGLVTDGASNVLMAETPSLDIGDAVTIEAWIRPTTLNATRFTLVDHDSGYALYVRANTLAAALLFTTAGLTSFERPATIPLGTWTHVALTFDSATTSLYVNGALVGTNAHIDTISTAGVRNVRIGGSLPSGEAFIGTIDDFRIWHSIRTPDELCRAAGTC